MTKKPPTLLEIAVDTADDIRFLLTTWKHRLESTDKEELVMTIISAEGCSMVGIMLDDRPLPGAGELPELVMRFTAPHDVHGRFLGDVSRGGYGLEERPGIPGMTLRYRTWMATAS